jgi:hypothetical protein
VSTVSKIEHPLVAVGHSKAAVPDSATLCQSLMSGFAEGWLGSGQTGFHPKQSEMAGGCVFRASTLFGVSRAVRRRAVRMIGDGRSDTPYCAQVRLVDMGAHKHAWA